MAWILDKEEGGATTFTLEELVESGEFGLFLNKHHNYLLENDTTYFLWFGNMCKTEALKEIAKLGLIK